MWCALRVLAGLETLPRPLRTGDLVCGIRVRDQIRHGPPLLRFHGSDGSRAYLVSQFYSLDTGAFLRWQTETRHALLPEEPGLLWPCREWEGGMVAPRPGSEPLAGRAEVLRVPETALRAARALGLLLVRLHALGMAHLHLSPRVAFYRPRRDEAFFGSFDMALRTGWDDFWTDAIPPARDPAWAAPEVLRGARGDRRADAFGFGALLHWLAAGRPPYGPVRAFCRELFLHGLAVRSATAASGQAPELLRVARDCLAADPADRPELREAVLELGASPGDVERALIPGPAWEPEPDAAREAGTPERIMAFVGGDGRAGDVFRAARVAAGQGPCLVLFVSLIPANLPSGHLERFKARLFADLGNGLWRCRGQGVSYGLRVLDNVVPSRAAEVLVRRYAPDRILVGRPASRHGAIRGGVVPRLERLGIAVEVAAETEGGDAAGRGSVG